jgi:hypothetical protein
MDEAIREYLKEHLTINIREDSFGFNGRCLVFELKLDDEVISSDSTSVKRDDD